MRKAQRIDDKPTDRFMRHALERILATRAIPPDFVMLYDDMHGLWGGMTMVIHGLQGQRHERARGNTQPERFDVEVDQRHLLELVALVVKLEAWKQKTPERPPVPDEGKATFTVRVDGQSSCLWEWCNELTQNQRLIEIKAMMSELTQPI